MNRQPRILVVDDEPVNAFVIEKLLGKTYQLCTVFNGNDALKAVKEFQPDLILMDVMMPDLNGFEVCKIIKAEESYADLPIIFMTAIGSSEDELKGIGLGGTDYLTKPLDFELLKLKTHNHVELKLRNDIIKEQRDQLEVALARVKQLEGILPRDTDCNRE